ncbi:MAG TPA: protein kinase [Candidatus Angelobacter sp.]|nr:protein kinase [Candidatus Angelobacter sp.]
MSGRVVGHYELLDVLGKGGIGTVYKARDQKLERDVAVKFLAAGIAGDADQKARFVREAKAASILDHPNICTIHEICETEDGQLFIVMAYCTGRSLRVRLESKPVSIGEAVDIAGKVAVGLQHAHQRGIIHRDIKPSNIMVAEDGTAKIVDFGLARFSQDDSLLTHEGEILGTVAYMSPEQVQGNTVDHRTDIWSWGVMFYEMLCGRRPFEGSSSLAIAEEILGKQPARPSSLRPIPGALDALLLQALEKDAGRRQQSAHELIDQLQEHWSSSRSPSPAKADSRVLDSVAVLPFANVGSAEGDYFSDGLTEEIIDALSRLPWLRVVARTSAFEFKGKPQNVSTIARQLKVRAIVEGSVRRSGDKLRVTSHLVNAEDGYCLWSQKFDCGAREVFAVQDEIAASIAQALKARADDETATITGHPQTASLKAYELYLRGRHQWNIRSGEGLQHALNYFEAALQHDPNYAAAYSGIADYHMAVASWGLERPAEAWPKAKAAAVRALEQDPNLAEAWASLGTISMWYDWEWKAAEREFLRAIALSPGHPNAHIQYNLLLVQTLRFSEAEDQVRKVLVSDPLSVRANSYLAGIFHYRREYDRSLEQCRRTLELDPSDVELHVILGLNYEQKKMFREAIQELDKARVLSGNNPLILGPLGSCFAGCGERKEAQRIIDELEQMSGSMYVTAITRAMVFLGMKDVDSAFLWLESAARAREVLVCYLAVGPIYDGVRRDPRYREMLQRIGLLGRDETASWDAEQAA